ncbi:uncharacterized protein OCT59_004689 [Rhizophagus irregularis]|uniref:Mkk2p n=4 Tax=Rhizophagus irregularis TaxID=588596 RepID=A0A015LC01_RHIIW|nr:Mkk2p [Rhizophagus irregularis DAOM 197198w]UZO13184.1 hypothetical protein OCT59_004689 [Rhizophagus irregularis]
MKLAINHKNCSTEKDGIPWCKECVPCCIIEGWSSGNHDIDEFIKNTIYNTNLRHTSIDNYSLLFLEWVPFERFKKIRQIGVGGFAKVYTAIWIDGQAIYKRQDDGNWKKLDPKPIKVALKRLNGSQNISAEYLNELKTHWDLNQSFDDSLKFYGMTKDPETKEFMMILEFAEKGNLRCFLSSNFNNILWKDKIFNLHGLAYDLKNLHKLGYFHRDFHSGNILQNISGGAFVSDFGLSRPSNEQISNKVCGVLPYIAPEVLNGEPYTLSSDIYSFGVIMGELSSGKPPFYKKKHDTTLALAICNGLRPEFGKGTPEFYKKLAHKCMNANPHQRPTAIELYEIIDFWDKCIKSINYQEKENFGYKGKEIKFMFKEADKEIQNISTSYEINPDAIYTSRVFTFRNLSNPINSPIITSLYLNDEENNKDCKDSQLFNLEVSSSHENDTD